MSTGTVRAMTPLNLNDKDAYVATLCTWGRKWMLSALRQRGLKQGKQKLTNRQLAEMLYTLAKQTRDKVES